MLTIKSVKEFCYDTIGVFLNSKEDLKVEKRNGYYFISFGKLRAPEYLVKEMWERRVAGTKYEQKVRFK